VAGIGNRMMHTENFSRAIAEFKLALSLCPKDEGVATELIRAYLQARDFANAEAASKSLLALHPHSETGQVLLAHSYLMERKFQYAGQTLQKLLAQDSRNPDALKLMGLTLFFYKENTSAESELRAALAIRPDDEEARYALGRIYQTQNNFPAAIETFKALIARDPNNYRAYDNLGVCYADTGKVDEANTMFNQAEQLASKLNPSDDWPYANQANMLIKEGRVEDALPCIERAIEINPRSARNQLILGTVLMGQNNLRAAKEHLEISIQLDPNFARSYYLLGRIYEKMNEPTKAQQEFAKFASISERAEDPGADEAIRSNLVP
jgi:tetratricopeptide (TPR) repeat protein